MGGALWIEVVEPSLDAKENVMRNCLRLLVSSATLGVLCACGGEVLQGVEDSTPVGREIAPLVAPVPTPGVGRDMSGLTSLGPIYTEQALSFHGGGGGAYTGHVTPPSVIYAVQVNSGKYVDHIRFAWYQPSGADNLYRSGDNWGNTQAFGGGGGGDNGWWYCPAGKGVIGLYGSSGAYVDRIGVVCGDVNAPNPYSSTNAYSPLWGGGGGGWFNAEMCTSGRLVDSFNVRSGSYLDGIQAICINAH